jgi:hypothetical protein
MILLAVTLGSLATLGFAQESKPMPMDQMKHEMKPGAMMPMDCKGRMQGQDAMQTKMKAMDEQLDKLVADMNTARGSKKVDKMAAVIDELVAQRKQMRDQMQTMMPMMMQHMMQHMQSGMMKGMTDSMSSCPMMNKDAALAEGHEHKH